MQYENIEAHFAEIFKEAVELIRKNQDGFHDALLDLNLPDAPNGEIVKFAIKAILRTHKNYDTAILVVDNSIVYRLAISDILKRLHIKILEAKDGLEALEVLDKHPDD